ncbi:MAG: hypothetical protein B6D39_07165 [Anaerolineae bacterium UTCFX2]|jgi:hypothetical protein|nr:hypothetical protein [Anaerolineae bacterium]MCZ7552891.1 hypothetical protein [Anaerolineales bacterium]OQY91447.1 MAG: hypothetical protein B6D39_07165 [Anaerolineae bacterium UTCFX2]
METSQEALHLEQGRNLARRLYDLKLDQLQNIDDNQQKDYLADFPLLSKEEFNDVRLQVIDAKRMQQLQVGWFSVPRDLAVLVFVLVTLILDWRWGAITATFTLILFESLFQVYFSPQMYAGLGSLVWFTYPAYVLLAWVLYSRGMAWYWIAVAVAGLWGGSYLAGLIVRIPMRFYINSRAAAFKRKSSTASGGNYK